MAVLGLRFCARAFSSCGKWGPLFIAVRGPLTIAASPVAEHRLQTRRLSSCGSRAQLLRGMWDPPRPGLEPVSPASAGRLSTTAPPGKPQSHFLKHKSNCIIPLLPTQVCWSADTHQYSHSDGSNTEILSYQFIQVNSCYLEHHLPVPSVPPTHIHCPRPSPRPLVFPSKTFSSTMASVCTYGWCLSVIKRF